LKSKTDDIESSKSQSGSFIQENRCKRCYRKWGTHQHQGKTIFDFNKMTLVGTNFLQENIVSGSTISIPCNVTSLNLEVNQPTTVDGQNVDYTWTGPFIPGGQITTNNVRTLTVTPTGGDGMIKVRATRADRDCWFQDYVINYTRPVVGDPTINLAWGGPIVCVGNTRFVTGVAANATSFVWAPVNTASLYAPSTNVNYAYVQFNSTTTLTLTVNNACNVPKTITKVINVGPPTFSTATVNGAPQQTPNYIQNPAFLSVNSDDLTASFSYQIAAYNGSISQIPWSPGGRSVYAYAYPFVQIQANTTNICGTNSTMFFLYNVTTFYRMASPNPAQNTISVELEKELGQQALVSVKLISHGRNAVERSFTAEDVRRTNHFERSNKIDFDVANLPRGTYYLMIDFKEGKKFKEIIVLN
jgi:hypothetical protein